MSTLTFDVVGNVVSQGAFIETPYDRIPYWPVYAPRANDLIVSGQQTISGTVNADSVTILPGGKLTFDPTANTTLTAQNVLVMEGGELRTNSTVAHSIIFPNVPTLDPEEYSNGLISMGTVTMLGNSHGRFVRLAVAPKAGAQTLSLAGAPLSWLPGDKLILTDSRHLHDSDIGDHYMGQWEYATVLSVSGVFVMLAAPLQFDHPGGPKDLPHVQNQSSNVTVRSASATGVRGHVMFTRRADVTIDNVRFAGLGRTLNDGSNRIGRYSAHFHHLIGPVEPQANGYQSTFTNNVITCPANQTAMNVRWGLTLHDSHYGLVEGNVIDNWAGAGIMEETACKGNVIRGNMVTRINGVTGGGAQDANPGSHGDGAWIAGPLSTWEGNVFATCRRGVTMYHREFSKADVPAFQGADPSLGQTVSVDLSRTPLKSFSGNEVYGAYNHAGLALEPWYLNADSFNAYDQSGGSVIDLVVWNCRTAISLYPNGWLAIALRHSLAPYPGEDQAGIIAADYLTQHLLVHDSTIEGVDTCIIPSAGSGTTMVVKDSRLQGMIGVRMDTLWTSGGDPKSITAPRDVALDNVTFDGSLSPHAVDVLMAWGGPSETHRNGVMLDRIVVNGQRRYYPQQSALVVVPQSTANYVGCPEAGLTNAQALAKYGICLAGEIAP